MANRGIKIILAGSACSGKTTLGNALCKEFPQFTVPQEAVRELCDRYSFDFTNGNSDLQLSILFSETLHLTDDKNYIGDGIALGSRVYTTYYRNHGKCDMSENVFRFYCDATRKLLRENVDLIIFLRSGEFPVVDDGFRVTDPEYVREVDEITEDLIVRMGLQDKTIIPHGTVEERVEFCRPYIDKLIR